MGSHAHLTIADVDGGDPRIIPVAGLTCSWIVSEVGTLSSIIPSRTAYLQDISEWKGRSISFEHITLGNWSGIILDDPIDLDNGTIELSAQDVARHLHGRIVPYFLPLQQSSAGGLVRRAMSLAAQETPFWLTDIVCAEDGLLYEPEARSDNLLDFVRQVANDSGQEWIAGKNDDGSLFFRWGTTVGEDKTDRILLIEGHQIAGGRITRSIEPMVNDVTVVADDRDFRRATAANAQNAASIATWGRVQASVRQSGIVNTSTVEPQARAFVRRSAVPVQAPTLRLPETHPILTEIRRGDAVRLWSASANAELAYRVLAITADTSAGTVELAGDAVAMDDYGEWGA